MLQRKENIILVKTEAFSSRIIRLYQYLQDTKNEKVMSKQILRSGTSVGANTAESRNAQSKSDFINKLNIALKEADETAYWLRCLRSGNYITDKQFASMAKDNDEIIRILVSIVKTSKNNLTQP